MTMNRDKNRKLTFLLLSVFWLLSAVYYASTPVAWRLIYGKPIYWQEMMDLGVQWLFCIPLSFFCLRLPARYPLQRDTRRRSLSKLALIGAGVCVILFVLDVLSFRVVTLAAQHPPPFWQFVSMVVVSRTHTYLLIYLLLTGLAYAIDYFQRSQAFEAEAARQAVTAAELQRDLTGARLQTLRMQLQPHFIFNAHHAIIGLMLNGEKDKAVGMLTRLSDLLRLTLKMGETLQVPLDQELALLRQYIEIQRIRFGDRLQVEIEVPADLHSAEVPSLILQPLVENAVRHGIEKHLGAGRLRVSAERTGDRLVLAVENSGPVHKADGAPVRQGIGLSTTRARLQQTYGEAHQFRVAPLPSGGMRAEMTIPLRWAEPANTAPGGGPEV